jgi:hypothetical protein
VLEAALAARNAALDRRALADASARRTAGGGAVTTPPTPAVTEGANGSVRLAGAPASREPSRPVIVRLPYRDPRPAPRPPDAIPDVRGLELRDAVRALHEAGFRVQVARGASGPAGTTSPPAGSLAPRGSLVRLLRDP